MQVLQECERLLREALHTLMPAPHPAADLDSSASGSELNSSVSHEAAWSGEGAASTEADAHGTAEQSSLDTSESAGQSRPCS